jgi:hypothetical protein
MTHEPPQAQNNGHDAPWLSDELVTCEAAVIEDVVVGFEEAVNCASSSWNE